MRMHARGASGAGTRRGRPSCRPTAAIPRSSRCVGGADGPADVLEDALAELNQASAAGVIGLRPTENSGSPSSLQHQDLRIADGTWAAAAVKDRSPQWPADFGCLRSAPMQDYKLQDCSEGSAFRNPHSRHPAICVTILQFRGATRKFPKVTR